VMLFGIQGEGAWHVKAHAATPKGSFSGNSGKKNWPAEQKIEA